MDRLWFYVWLSLWLRLPVSYIIYKRRAQMCAGLVAMAIRSCCSPGGSQCAWWGHHQGNRQGISAGREGSSACHSPRSPSRAAEQHTGTHIIKHQDKSYVVLSFLTSPDCISHSVGGNKITSLLGEWSLQTYTTDLCNEIERLVVKSRWELSSKYWFIV